MSEALRKRPAGLGRGLSALLGEASVERSVDQAERLGLQTAPVASLQPHPEQPRRHFDDGSLDELAQSIAARGLIQPIVVRPVNGGYQIVAGERRWRAAQRARLHDVPIVVHDFDEAETLEIALVENIQREDLNAIEEAEAYRKLIDRFGHTQDALARIVHKSRSHVANLLRLLDLPAEVRSSVADGRLSMGHARAIVTAEDPRAIAAKVIASGLSVRETEALARRARGTDKPSRPSRSSRRPTPDADIVALERQLGDLLGLAVQITHADDGGQVAIGYRSLDQLDMICQRLTGEII